MAERVAAQNMNPREQQSVYSYWHTLTPWVYYSCISGSRGPLNPLPGKGVWAQCVWVCWLHGCSWCPSNNSEVDHLLRQSGGAQNSASGPLGGAALPSHTHALCGLMDGFTAPAWTNEFNERRAEAATRSAWWLDASAGASQHVCFHSIFV